MMISSGKLVKRIEELRRLMLDCVKASCDTDGNHCYLSSIRAYNNAIQAVLAESYEARKLWPDRKPQEIVDIKKRCRTALNLLKRCERTKAITILEKAIATDEGILQWLNH
jgi:hypothetical protein